MCDPISLALVAASAGASAIGQSVNNSEAAKNQQRQYVNARQVQAARDRELDESRARQKTLSDSNNQTFQNTLGKFEQPAQQASTEAAQADATQTFAKSVTPADGSYQVQGSAPGIVQQAFDKVTKDVNARGITNATRLGTLDAYKGTWAGNNVALQGAGRSVDTNNGFSQSEASLLPSYQEFAQAQTERPNGGAKRPSGIGDALMAVGKIGSSIGGGNLAPGSTSEWFGNLGTGYINSKTHFV